MLTIFCDQRGHGVTGCMRAGGTVRLPINCSSEKFSNLNVRRQVLNLVGIYFNERKQRARL